MLTQVLFIEINGILSVARFGHVLRRGTEYVTSPPPLGRWMTSLERIEEFKDETTITLGGGICVAAVFIARYNHGLDDRGV